MIRTANNQSIHRVRAIASAITCFILLASFLAVAPAQAATITWTGSSSTIWSNSGNWNPTTVPGSSDEADFTGTFSISPSVTGGSALGQFHVLGSLAQSFTSNIGGVLNLAASNGSIAILIDQNAAPNAAVTIAGGGGLIAGAGQSWVNNNTNGFGNGQYSLVVASTMGIGGSVAMAGSGNTEISGLISGGGSLAVNGPGALALTASNNFTGGVTLSSTSSGLLDFDNARAIGTGTFIIRGGTLDNNSGAAITNARNNSQIWTGNFTFLGTDNLNMGNGSVSVVNSVNVNVAGGTLAVGGAISGSGGLTKSGPGLLMLSGNEGSGINSANAITVSAGVLKVGASNVFSQFSDLTVNGGTLDVTGFAQVIRSVTVGNAGSLNLTIGDLLGTLTPASFGGTLDLFGSTSGTRELISYPSFSGNFSNVNGVPAGFALYYTPTQLDLMVAGSNNSILGASTSSVSLGRVMLNFVPTTNVTISLTGGTSATGFGASASGGATATASHNGPGAVTSVSSGSVSVGLANATGSYSGTVQVQNSGDDGLGDGPTSGGPGQGNAQLPISIGVSGTVVANRVVTSTSASLAPIHLGQAVSYGITLSTTGSDSQFTRVTVADGGPDANGISVTGGSNPIFNDPSVTDSRTVSGTFNVAGFLNGTIILTTSGEGLAGESPINVPVNYTAQVFSGSGRWTGASGNSWGTNGSWIDSNGSGVQAAPGVFAGFNDTAVLNDSAAVRTLNLDGATPHLSSLLFSTSSGSGYVLGQGSGGSLVLANGPNPATLSVLNGAHTISAPMSLASPVNITLNGASTALTLAGNLSEASPGQALNLAGGGKLTMSGTSTFTGGTTVSQGTLNVTGAMLGGTVLINGGAVLTGSGLVQSSITGYAGSKIVATGNLALGDSTAYTGFNHAGTLAIGGNTVTLNSAGFANLGILTSLDGGTLVAPNGVSLGIGGNLVGSGAVNGKVAAGQGSTISATGNLTLGDSTSPAGFTSAGELYTGSSTVTLQSANQTVLGSLTQIGAGGNAGTLDAVNGLVLDFGNNLVGQGTVNTGNTLATPSIINGNVDGTGSGLNFTGYIKGAGSFAGTVTFSGSYSPGNSPAAVSVGNVSFGPVSGLILEVGGTTPGSEYDQLEISGLATLNGTLDVKLLNGFSPADGQNFEFFNGPTTGSFSQINLPALSSGLSWDTSNLYTTGEITVVPEPSTFVLLGVAWLGVLALRGKRRGQR